MSRSSAADLAYVRRVAELWDNGDQEVGFHPRLFCQLALPYREQPADLSAWGRRNGDMSLLVQPGVTMGADGRPISTGYPFGTIPRLLLTWLATEAKRTGQQEMVLGENLADFMRQLGLGARGGVRGDITRLREQMNRLFKARISVDYHGDAQVDAGIQMQIATAKVLWWSSTDRNADQRSLLPSTVRLSGEFFQEVIEHPVPISFDVLRTLRKSPLRLDIYAWLTHRMSYLRRRTTVSWEQLAAQFGSSFADDRFGRAKFRKHFKDHLAEVLLAYQDANVELCDVGVILRPSKTHIAPRAGQLALPSI